MKKRISKSMSVITPLLMFALSLIAIAFIGRMNKEDSKNQEDKIFFEYCNSENAITVANNLSSVPAKAYSEENEFSMQIMLKYDQINDTLYKENHKADESYVSYSKRYHTGKNKEILSEIDITDYKVFISEYTPYVFITSTENSSIDQIYDLAKKIAANQSVENIRIYPSDIYHSEPNQIEITSMPNSSNDEERLSSVASVSSEDLRITEYDNFPESTPYSGNGIKIGLFDTGIFDPSHSNFSEITAITLLDTYTENDDSSGQHPTLVASVLGGKYGYASNASIYYVDVNSVDPVTNARRYANIEKLINAECDIINMSISAHSCNNNGNYDTGLEAYLDYIYVSTKVVMVAAAGNTLDLEGSGGYVTLPALCANVISVGSIAKPYFYVPSTFSSYNIKNDVESNPNLVARGEDRIIDPWNEGIGTSFSAPAVTGAIALYFEKNGIKELPELLAALSVTANDKDIYKRTQTIELYELDSEGDYVLSGNTINCPNTRKENGTCERTGAGMLDVTALLNNPITGNGNEIIFTSDDLMLLKIVHLTAGQKIQVALAWQRNATTSYQSDTLPDFDLYLTDNNDNSVASSTAGSANVEMLTFEATVDGYYRIQIVPYSDYATIQCINYAYVIK